MSEEIIKERLEQLNELLKAHPNKGLAMMKARNAALFPLDFLAVAVYKRSMSLISGFSMMIDQKNFVCAAPLVRLQLDNALRFYAASLVDKPNDLAIGFISGKPIKEFRDKANGKKLTDSYLVEKLSETFEWMTKVYKETSGYIHLSEKHFFNTIKRDNAGFSISVGVSDSSITDKERLYAIDTMIAITNVVLWLIDSWTYIKDKKGMKQ
jgi:hypothetical protein